MMTRESTNKILYSEENQRTVYFPKISILRRRVMILAPMRPIPKILDTAPHKHECRRNTLGRILSTFEQSNGPHFILVAEWNAYISKSGRRERFDISRSIDPGGQGAK